MTTYSIRDIEYLTGIQAHTIRIWEQRYNMFCPQRTDTNIRTYNDDELKLLLNISLLNKAGYRIGHIAKMNAEEMSRHLTKLNVSENIKLEIAIKALTLAMVELDEGKFDHIFQKAVMQSSFEDVMLQIIYPFLLRIGIMWTTKHINPAQEHFITNLIRQKIIAAIDSQMVEKKPTSKHFLLFLPENEMHELGLLFLNYLLKARCQKVTYLGINVSLKDIEEVINICKPDYLYTILTTSLNQGFLNDYIQKMSLIVNNGNTCLISGQYVPSLSVKLPHNIKILPLLPDILEFIDTLNN